MIGIADPLGRGHAVVCRRAQCKGWRALLHAKVARLGAAEVEDGGERGELAAPEHQVPSSYFCVALVVKARATRRGFWWEAAAGDRRRVHGLLRSGGRRGEGLAPATVERMGVGDGRQGLGHKRERERERDEERRGDGEKQGSSRRSCWLWFRSGWNHRRRGEETAAEGDGRGLTGRIALARGGDRPE